MQAAVERDREDGRVRASNRPPGWLFLIRHTNQGLSFPLLAYTPSKTDPSPLEEDMTNDASTAKNATSHEKARDQGEQDSGSGPVDRMSIPQWRYAPDAWRWVRRLDRRHAGSFLRARSARGLPQSMRARFLVMGIPEDTLVATLSEIRSPEQWADAWIETAQRYLGDYRRQVSSRNPLEAAQARRLSALCYHAAQMFVFDDERTVRMCRAAAATLFAQAQPLIYPHVRRLAIPWRSSTLPGYFLVPGGQTRAAGLVVILNGTSTSKEETFAWAPGFLRAGLAVLVMDSPGTGEATGMRIHPADADDIIDGVFEVFASEPMIDPAQVSVVGVSLGGNQALRCAVYDRRIMSVVSVTPPYDPARWIHRASPLLHGELGMVFGDDDRDPYEQVAELSLHDHAVRARCPVLVLGGGRDLVVPPSESQLLATRLGAIGTLSWYPNGGHCLYGHLRGWTSDAATWIASVGAARAIEMQMNGRADPVEVAAMAREQLIATDPLEVEAFGEEDHGTARLIDPDQGDLDDLGASARVISSRSDGQLE